MDPHVFGFMNIWVRLFQIQSFVYQRKLNVICFPNFPFLSASSACRPADSKWQDTKIYLIKVLTSIGKLSRPAQRNTAAQCRTAAQQILQNWD